MTGVVLTEAQLECLASPVRAEVFHAVRTLGKASVAELAKHLGRSPESVHYHVRALAAAALLVLSETRPTERRPEAVYTSSAAAYRLPKGESRALVAKAVLCGQRQMMRAFMSAAEDPEAAKYLSTVRVNATLSLEDFEEFKRRIEEAAEFVSSRRTENGVRIGWSSLIVPSLPSAPKGSGETKPRGTNRKGR